nr:hypothetical protein [Tanacetum cinerariifolium]
LKLRRLKKVGSAKRIDTLDDAVIDDVSKQGGIIENIDADEDVVLEDAKDVAADAKVDQDAEEEETKPAELQEVVDVVTTAKIITEVVTTASTIITAAADVLIPAATTAAALTLTTTPSRRRKGVVIRDPQETTTPSTIIHSEAKPKDKGKGILVEEPKPLKKQAQIEQDEHYARELVAELNKNIDWDVVINHVNKKAKEDNTVKRYQALKRKPQTEAPTRKNMMIYLKNVAGFKMGYFKGMSYDDIRPVFKKYFDSNVAFLQKTKEQMDEEDSRALKRLNETQKEKAAKKQKLDEEVEELKRHLQIVPNEEDDVYTEATPLALKVPVVDYEIYNQNNKPYYKIKRADVERRYPLIRFTLDQMLNNVRLKVEEESEVSLELLRPDIQFSTCLCAKYQANPKESHVITVKRIFRKSTSGAYQLLGGKLIEAFTKSPNQYKEYLFKFWYTAKALKNSKLWFSTPTRGILGEVGVNTFRNSIGAHYLSHSTEYVATPPLEIVKAWFSTIGYSGEIRANGTLKKSYLPPRWRLLMAQIIQCLEKHGLLKAPKTSSKYEKKVPKGTKPGAKSGQKKKQIPFTYHHLQSKIEANKAKSKAEADSSLSAPKNLISQTTSNDEGPNKLSLDHIFVGKTKFASEGLETVLTIPATGKGASTTEKKIKEEFNTSPDLSNSINSYSKVAGPLNNEGALKGMPPSRGSIES